MSIKGLDQFFDSARFLAGKELKVTGISAWKDFATKQILGSKVDVVIVEDRTEYVPKASGEAFTNQYEKFSVKVAKGVNDLQVSVGMLVVLVNPVIKVYGEYHNMLSAKADDVQPASASPAGNGGKS